MDTTKNPGLSFIVYLALVFSLLSFAACGDDSGSDAGRDGGGTDAPADSPAVDGTTDSTGTDAQDAGGSDGGTGDWVRTPALGKLFVGNFLSPFRVQAYDGESLALENEFDPMGAAGQVRAYSAKSVVTVIREGQDFIHVIDEAASPIAGSPYDTAHFPVATTHDDVRELLYVYCIGTEGVPSESLITVFDTSTVPFTEVAGSPFEIDVAANEIAVDPITGNLFGLGLSSTWGGSIDTGAFTHLPGSPADVEGSGSAVVVDPSRSKVYFGERTATPGQTIVIRSTSTFEVDSASPITLNGRTLGDLAINRESGHLYAVAFGSAQLFAVQLDPVMVLDICGESACTIPPTETGLAIDEDENRLYITHLPSLENPDDGPGFLTVWDVATPASPTEVTMSGERPRLLLYPNQASVL